MVGPAPLSRSPAGPATGVARAPASPPRHPRTRPHRRVRRACRRGAGPRRAAPARAGSPRAVGPRKPTPKPGWAGAWPAPINADTPAGLHPNTPATDRRFQSHPLDSNSRSSADNYVFRRNNFPGTCRTARFISKLNNATDTADAGRPHARITSSIGVGSLSSAS